jgi:hypothetical protein
MWTLVAILMATTNLWVLFAQANFNIEASM